MRARIESDGRETEGRLFLAFMDQSGTTQRRKLDRERKEADAIIADKVISSSAIYDDDLDVIEERVENYGTRTDGTRIDDVGPAV